MKDYQKIWNYNGDIYDMGLEPNENGEPAFYILTESGDHIQVTITKAENIAMVRDYLKNLNTGVHVEFKDFEQFHRTIQKVFKVYAGRYGLVLGYDSNMIKEHLEGLKGFATEYDVARIAGVGRSTVNDLRRGITQRPRFFTMCKVRSAIYQLECEKKETHKRTESQMSASHP